MREHTLQAQPYQGERHEKAWGHELWIVNNEKYCGKLLVFDKDKQFSMHYHLIKDEAWYISKGDFEYKFIDTETAKEYTQKVTVGDCIRLLPGQPHQMKALTDGATIFEVSTQHFDSDSYRVKPGETQIVDAVALCNMTYEEAHKLSDGGDDYKHTESYYDSERNK